MVSIKVVSFVDFDVHVTFDVLNVCLIGIGLAEWRTTERLNYNNNNNDEDDDDGGGDDDDDDDDNNKNDDDNKDNNKDNNNDNNNKNNNTDGDDDKDDANTTSYRPLLYTRSPLCLVLK